MDSLSQAEQGVNSKEARVDKNKIAYLSNNGSYTIFSYGDYNISFLTSKRLRRYIRIKEWDKEFGYLVVDRENDDSTVVEDYIDLFPILENLYMNPDLFLKNIEKVRLNYD